ncbi:MAG: hypothetical protein LAP38_18830 [Acidobacteriia bacterium]|nr:hypothetical protein [Terriglobia bacterium]
MILDRAKARSLIREVIKTEFSRLAKRGRLQALAKQIGIKDYQNLQNYANGAVPQADTFLLACIYLGWVVKLDYVEEEGPRIGQMTHLEFTVRERAAIHAAPQGEQLNLFDAIDQLGQESLQVTITRKLMDRLELTVGIDFQKAAS